MKIIQLAEAKLKDLRHYLILQKDKYEVEPEEETKQVIQQTIDEIEMLEESIYDNN